MANCGVLNAIFCCRGLVWKIRRGESMYDCGSHKASYHVKLGGEKKKKRKENLGHSYHLLFNINCGNREQFY